jgi:hypothetical protein
MENLVILKSAAGGQSSLGATGLSAYQLWLMMPGNAGKTMLEFFEALKGDKGDKGASVFDTWLSLPQNQGKDVGDFMQAMRGDAGYSAFELWKLDTGNTEASFIDFLAALKGEKGETGNSAFDAWLMIAGNENKTLEDFVLAIKGDKGDKGDQGIQGIQGIQGLKGDKGDTGADGVLGFLTGLLNTAVSFVLALPTDSLLQGISKINASLQYLKNNKQDNLGYTPENIANKNAVNGYAGLDNAGKVPASLLPSYVDDVLEFLTRSAFPLPGESGKIYTDSATDKIYRWSGSTYVNIAASPGSTDSVTEGATNLYFTTSRVLNALLTGLSFASNLAITATDSIIVAFGKLQAQITSIKTTADAALPKTGGAMANSNLVTNLNADQLDGKHATDFSASNHTHDYFPNTSLPDITFGVKIGFYPTSAEVFIPFFKFGAELTTEGSYVYGTFFSSRSNAKNATGNSSSMEVKVFAKNSIWAAGSNQLEAYYDLLHQQTSTAAYFATALINGVLWFGLRYYSFQDYSLWFKGDSSNALSPIAYRTTYNTTTILNQEVNDSITQYNNPNNRNQLHNGFVKYNASNCNLPTVDWACKALSVASNARVPNLNADLLDGFEGAYYKDYAKYIIPGQIGWVRIAKLTTPATGWAYGTINITNEFNTISAKPISFSFATGYREGKYIYQFGGDTTIVKKARLVLPTGTSTDLNYYIEIYVDFIYNSNNFFITLQNHLNTTLYQDYTAGAIPTDSYTFERVFYNNSIVVPQVVADSFATASTLKVTNFNADLLDGFHSTAFCRTAGEINLGGSLAAITTADFITYLATLGAFDTGYWVSRGSWNYSLNKYISDSPAPIVLAGAVVEVIGYAYAYTIRINTPTTFPAVITGALVNRDYVYVNNGTDYAPGWRVIINDKTLASKTQTGALSLTDYGKFIDNYTDWVASNTVFAQGNVSGTPTFDFTNRGIITATATANITNFTITGIAAGHTCLLILTVNAGITVTMPTGWKKIATATVESGKTNTFSFLNVDGTIKQVNVAAYE